MAINVYIVMNFTKAWKKGSSITTDGHYVIDPQLIAVYDSYDKAEAYIERHKEYKKDHISWITDVRDLPGNSDYNCYSRMYICERVM